MVTRALPYRPHNHQACVNQALDDARHICQQHNARLTPTRQRVLELIWQSHRPLGAYDVLAQLAAEGQNAAPPTVYRALDFLQQHGLVHRIASLNAFVGCAHPGKPHTRHVPDLPPVRQRTGAVRTGGVRGGPGRRRPRVVPNRRGDTGNLRRVPPLPGGAGR